MVKKKLMNHRSSDAKQFSSLSKNEKKTSVENNILKELEDIQEHTYVSIALAFN